MATPYTSMEKAEYDKMVAELDPILERLSGRYDYREVAAELLSAAMAMIAVGEGAGATIPFEEPSALKWICGLLSVVPKAEARQIVLCPNTCAARLGTPN